MMMGENESVTEPKTHVRKQRWNYYRYLAIICWLSSLAFPAIIFSTDALRGMTVLALGWAGVFVLNFSWLANIFFLRALAVVKKTAIDRMFYCVTALVLGAHALMFKGVPSYNPDSGESIVIGYGLGFVLWLLAFILITLATATEIASNSNRESVNLNFSEKISLFFWEGFFLIACVTFVIYSVFSFYTIRTTASDYQKYEFRNMVFSLEALCTVSVPRVSFAPPHARLVEYQDNRGIIHQNPYEAVDIVRDILVAGAEAVQYKGKQFYIDKQKDGGVLLYFTPITRRADLRITYQTDEIKEGGNYVSKITTLSIYDLDNDVALFDNQWVSNSKPYPTGRSYRTCPAWRAPGPKRGRGQNYPRRAFLDLFDDKGVNETHFLAGGGSSQWKYPFYISSPFRSYEYEGKLNVRPAKPVSNRKTPRPTASSLSSGYGCPATIGYVTGDDAALLSKESSRFDVSIFRVNEKTYLGVAFRRKKLFCTPEYIYTYEFTRGQKMNNIYIKGWDVNDLSAKRELYIDVDNSDAEVEWWDDLEITQFKESAAGIEVSVRDPKTGFSGEIKANLIPADWLIMITR